MVLRANDVIINISSKTQETKMRKILQPTENDLRSPEFKERVSQVAKGFVSARKGMENLRKLLG
ncbi:hypothetical protein [Leuconostoc mesenteroides]|uniref:hypothetical protein n=1 Tax=Leuconostoc mesenteroides TaxID=1245 RepID=UPI000B9D7622|nr:hypothetical protein [Leuconostoc mesenteroides]QHM55733.1 hypothetical protein C7M43_00435 [Leuconostoc mesenteroides]BAX73090.1 mitosis entry checkpoint [Leuconostoc mesenteroides]